MKSILAVDLFCGAGGASLALRAACASMGIGLDLLAVNHWPRAIETHSANHPNARHLCHNVEDVTPAAAVPGGHLDLLMAGPSCTYYSRARGGLPSTDQQRSSPDLVLRWLRELDVQCLALCEGALCEPFVLQQQSGGVARLVGEPLPTIASRGAQSLVQPFLVPLFGERPGQTPRTHSVEQPLPTVTASKGGPALVEAAFLSKYYGTGGSSSVAAPVPTITTKDRHGLVMPVINGVALDIRFRMLQPHELAAAMGFGVNYEFRGTKEERVRQIGNAWPVRLGQALISELLAHHASKIVEAAAG